jgi:hypothetical protein
LLLQIGVHFQLQESLADLLLKVIWLAATAFHNLCSDHLQWEETTVSHNILWFQALEIEDNHGATFDLFITSKFSSNFFRSFNISFRLEKQAMLSIELVHISLL